ncbi:MAG: 4-phosphopantoate--beta-alanine ligase [Methanobacteriota archaeon]
MVRFKTSVVYDGCCMKGIPKTHPRYLSLVTRERIAEAMKEGLVHETGLIAHGRGEAFDYLLGEMTISPADAAMKVAAMVLVHARNPVISVNGNVVALAAEECVALAGAVPAFLEVNLFHRSSERVQKVADELRRYGAKEVLGESADAVIPGLAHDRALCTKKGVFSADVVVVPLEDGDRCEALRRMGKTVVAIDLNPLSRTARAASVTIVDNVVRALPRLVYWVGVIRTGKAGHVEELVGRWDNEGNLCEVMGFLSKRLNALF